MTHRHEVRIGTCGRGSEAPPSGSGRPVAPARDTIRAVETTAQVTAIAVASLNVLAGVVGAWLWWRVETTSVLFWRLVRAGQAAAAVMALVAGVLFASGAEPEDGLLWLYLLLPVPVGFVAEQLRAVSAQTVLDARGLESAQQMRELDEATQRSIVVQIVRKEMGVMTVAAFTIAFLAIRALGVTEGL